jgi:DNA-3-methyladenine glycosylase II
MKPLYWDEATTVLAHRDPVLGALFERFPDIHLRRRSDPFTTLARAIVGQQISVKAAETVWQRLVTAVVLAPTRRRVPKLDAGIVCATPLAVLRGCGLSQRKAEYLGDLAGHFVTGRLDPRRWKRMDDEALIGALVDVKGIGRWTAEMFLMFHALRPDVLPVDDVGLQKAFALHYTHGVRPDASTMRAIAAPWQPWRSVATWYLWRSLDPLPVEY